MVDYSTYLDLYQLFINDIVGSENSHIFIFLSFIVISVIASKTRFPNTITLAVFIIYSVIISVFFQSIMAITLLVVAMLFAWALSRLLNRG